MSNLSFISKLIKKAVANRLNSYNNKEGLSNLNQSAYKRLHSTETALLKFQNDIAASMESDKAVSLRLLDLSAAFFLNASEIGLGWMALCGCGSNLVSQIADRRLNWVIVYRMPSI